MTVPVKRVRIIGKYYSVNPVSGRQFSGNEHYGEIDYANQRVLYDEEQSGEQLKDTLIHESVHGIDYAMQIGLEERQVAALGTGFYAWMVENKRLVRWIIGDTK